jgi:hypothetical protein
MKIKSENFFIFVFLLFAFLNKELAKRIFIFWFIKIYCMRDGLDKLNLVVSSAEIWDLRRAEVEEVFFKT